LEECLRKLERDGDSNIRREAEQFSNLHFLYKACLTRESLWHEQRPTKLKATNSYLIMLNAGKPAEYGIAYGTEGHSQVP
jgi:hypothetical protein